MCGGILLTNEQILSNIYQILLKEGVVQNLEELLLLIELKATELNLRS